MRNIPPKRVAGLQWGSGPKSGTTFILNHTSALYQFVINESECPKRSDPRNRFRVSCSLGTGLVRSTDHFVNGSNSGSLYELWAVVLCVCRMWRFTLPTVAHLSIKGNNAGMIRLHRFLLPIIFLSYAPNISGTSPSRRFADVFCW